MSNVISGSNQQQLYPNNRLSGSRVISQDGLQTNQSFGGHSVELSRTPQALHTTQSDSSLVQMPAGTVTDGYAIIKVVTHFHQWTGLDKVTITHQVMVTRRNPQVISQAISLLNTQSNIRVCARFRVQAFNSITNLDAIKLGQHGQTTTVSGIKSMASFLFLSGASALLFVCSCFYE